MFFVLEWFNRWLLVFIIDATFSSIPIDIGKLIDCEGMLLVKGSAMKLSCCGGGLFWSIVLDEGESSIVRMYSVANGLVRCLPFRQAFVIHGHEYGILPCLACGVEFF